jgi:DNA-binding NtrC family response regulator
MARPEVIWLIDDDGAYRAQKQDQLNRAGYTNVIPLEDGVQALDLIRTDRKRPDLVLLDLEFLNCAHDGIYVLTELRNLFGKKELPIVILTNSREDIDLVRALKAGANDYVEKGRSDEVLLARVQKELAERRRELELEEYRRSSSHAGPMLIGESPRWKEVLDRVCALAAADLSICLVGETGTGKEQVAKFAHIQSQRRDREFVAVNCSAVPTTLFETEFFGFVRGAHNMAHKDRLGFVRFASGGTLFLDEVGEMPLECQPKLLRVLQEKRVRPLGTEKEDTVDLRIIAATCVDLEEAIRQGRFRADLAARIAPGVNSIRLPPLRERAEDVELLARAYLASRIGSRAAPMGISSDAMTALKNYSWPQNVRELVSVVEHCTALVLYAGKDEIAFTDLPAEIRLPGSSRPAAVNGFAAARTLPELESHYREAKRSLILKVQEATGGTIDGKRGAAKQLDVPPATLRDAMKDLGLVQATNRTKAQTAAKKRPAKTKPKSKTKRAPVKKVRKHAAHGKPPRKSVETARKGNR